jgi:hypothetical protein
MHLLNGTRSRLLFGFFELWELSGWTLARIMCFTMMTITILLSVVGFECMELCNGDEVVHRPEMTVIFGPEAVQQEICDVVSTDSRHITLSFLPVQLR